MLLYVGLLFVFLHFSLGSRECPPLATLPNVRYLRINLQSVQLECEGGRILIGNKKATCYNGAWTPAIDAICFTPMNLCPPPPDVPNAERIGDDREIGSRSHYKCNPGYFMIGRSLLKCTNHMIWDHDPPVCTARLTKVDDIAERIRNEAGLREAAMNESVESDSLLEAARNGSVESNMRGLILDKDVYKKGLELFLLLDRSSSVESSDLELSKSFLQALIETFGVDNSLKNSKTRLTVITFGDKAKVVLDLNNKSVNSAETAMLHINAIKPEGGGTAMEPALSTVLEFLKDLREESMRALFLLTDGEPTAGDTPPEDVADLLRKKKFEIFTVGIGRDINHERLAKIASEPADNHVFFLDTFQDLDTIMELVQNPPPTPPPIPPPGPDACGVNVQERSPSKPWLTAIVVHFPKESTTTFCAGVLICSQWVLTSAACLINATDSQNAFQIALIVGAHSLEQSGHNAYAMQVRISAQEQEDRTANFKLALVNLDHPVPSNVARPVCLHNHNIPWGPFHELQVPALIEGWGTRNWNSSLITRNLTASANRRTSLASNVTTLQDYLCFEALRNRTDIKKPSEDEFICAGSVLTSNSNPNKDSCVGSLGSPLVIKDDQGRYQLLGVQTHHHGCIDQPIIYLNTTRYIPWIQRVTNNCQEKHRN